MAYFRLYYFHPRSHGIVKFDEIEAADDTTACAKAEKRRGDHALELWCGARKVAQFEATDIASRLITAKKLDSKGVERKPNVADTGR